MFQQFVKQDLVWGPEFRIRKKKLSHCQLHKFSLNCYLCYGNAHRSLHQIYESLFKHQARDNSHEEHAI